MMQQKYTVKVRLNGGSSSFSYRSLLHCFAQTLLSQLTHCQIWVASANNFSIFTWTP